MRIGYWNQDSQTQVESSMVQLREDRGLTEEPAWTVNYYPADGPVGLIEFLLVPQEGEMPAVDAAGELPVEEPPEESSEEIPEELDEATQETSPEKPKK